jgi:hypothetical protein
MARRSGVVTALARAATGARCPPASSWAQIAQSIGRSASKVEEKAMIKILGFAGKLDSLTTEECQTYHMTKHGPFGRTAAGHLGLMKYVGYYPFTAIRVDGSVLETVPWAVVVNEWFTDEFFRRSSEWRATDPVGIEATADEARHVDRQTGHMAVCDEEVLKDSGAKADHYVIFALKKHSGVDQAQFTRVIENNIVAEIIAGRADALQWLNVLHVKQMYNLTEGLLASNLNLYDRFICVGVDESPLSQAITRYLINVAEVLDRRDSIVMSCRKRAFIA